jgi:hypothetical protein
MAFLSQNDTNAGVTSIRLHYELIRAVGQGQNRGRHMGLLECIKGSLLCKYPDVQSSLLEESCQRLADNGVLLNKFMIITCDTKKASKFIQTGWYCSFSD